MGRFLTDVQIGQFRAEGWAGPLRVYSEDKMAELRQRLEKFEAAHPTEVGKLYQGPHLLFPWLYDILHVPHLVDAWQDLFGPNLLVVTTGFRIKDPSTKSYVGWHQDAYYVRYEPFWSTCILAFTESTIENGCVQVVPGSHKWGLLPHEETGDEDNMLTRGQHITVPFDQSQAIHVTLRPGELIAMDHMLIHGSEQNHSKSRRINFLIDVLPTHARREGKRESGILVAGEDTYGYYDLEDRPQDDFGPLARERHRAVITRRNEKTYVGSKRVSPALK
jgi:hypothetical protein